MDFRLGKSAPAHSDNIETDQVGERALCHCIRDHVGPDSQQRIERLRARFGLRGVNFASGPTPSILSPHLHVSYFSPTWYQADENNLLPQTLFVGGAPTPPADQPPDWLTAIPPDVPLALITLGTTFTGDLGFFSWAAQAAARVGFVHRHRGKPRSARALHRRWRSAGIAMACRTCRSAG